MVLSSALKSLEFAPSRQIWNLNARAAALHACRASAALKKCARCCAALRVRLPSPVSQAPWDVSIPFQLLALMNMYVCYAAKMAFAPPQPASYEFREQEHQLHMYISNPFEPSDTTRRKFEPFAPLHIIRDIRTRRGNTLAAFYIEVQDSPLTILFSHGNAVDIGVMSVFLASLSAQINCSIFAYDYSGKLSHGFSWNMLKISA